MSANAAIDFLAAPPQTDAGDEPGWLQALRDIARKRGCQYLHLDSGTQRKQAHRFYLREGMEISNFHFDEKLDK